MFDDVENPPGHHERELFYSERLGVPWQPDELTDAAREYIRRTDEHDKQVLEEIVARGFDRVKLLRVVRSLRR